MPDITERNDIQYGSTPGFGGYNPFMVNPLTQGQATALANTTANTTTTTTTSSPTVANQTTSPYIPVGSTAGSALSDFTLDGKYRVQRMAMGGLAGIAGKVQGSGRGQDTQLVHMTPKEVEGLQALAQAHGGSLTINPTTGLPEAGFLSDILPTVVGAGVGVATGNPMLGAAVGGGLGMAMSGGNIQRGITSGMGAYGFGSLGAGLAGTGAGVLGAEAGNASLAQAFPGDINMPGIPNMDVAAQALKEGAITAPQYEAIAQQYSNAYANAANNAGAMGKLSSGLGATKLNSDFFSNNAIPLGAAGLGLLSTIGSGSSSGQGPATGGSGYIRPYTYSQTRNPLFGQPGQPYFIQKYTAQPVVSATQWGSQSLPTTTTMAEGGLASLSQNAMYPTAGTRDHAQYATPTQMPVSAEVLNAGYDPATDPYTGQMRFAQGGVMQSDLGGYSDGGRLLKGPGDGVSDSIPATIKGKQPARLADGEFVIPARVVSEIGNGSTDAGARKLYAMMDRVQNKRSTTAKKGNLAMDSKAEKVLPA